MFSGGIERDQWREMGQLKTYSPHSSNIFIVDSALAYLSNIYDEGVLRKQLMARHI